MTNPTDKVHKAAPLDRNLGDAGPYHCVVCGQRVKLVPGGQGIVWVHADSGAVAAPNPPDTRRDGQVVSVAKVDLSVAGDVVEVVVGDQRVTLSWTQAASLGRMFTGMAVTARSVDMHSTCRTTGGYTGPHQWVLTEDGYVRSWSTRIDYQAATIDAVFDGSSDFSEDGDGVYLECYQCGSTCEVPDGFEINYM